MTWSDGKLDKITINSRTAQGNCVIKYGSHTTYRLVKPGDVISLNGDLK